MTEQRIPKIGDAVKVVTSDYKEAYALVTAVHGEGYEFGGEFMPPLINAVYVTDDETKRDSYGRQIMRDLTSLNHFKSTQNMPKRGRYYDFL